MNKPNILKKFANIDSSQYRALIILILIVVASSFVAPSFFTFGNLTNVIRQVSMSAIIACGMTFVILTGGIDLSVGAILGFSGALSASVMGTTGSLFLAILTGLGVGLTCGIINAIFITHYDLPPFIVTLATMTLLAGSTLLFTKGAPIAVKSEAYKFIGKGEILGIPLPIIILTLIYVVAYFVLSYTRFGRNVYALGGNKEATRLSGINIKLNEATVYAITGLLCGIAGIILTARLGSAGPDSGKGYELDAIAAVILGGTSLSGGQGFILPTIVGALILGILSNILTLMDVNPFVSGIVKGIVILVAIVIDKKFKSISSKGE
ncbi:MAG: ribose ABC transporter permease [Oscillospiraceae bacterium]